MNEVFKIILVAGLILLLVLQAPYKWQNWKSRTAAGHEAVLDFLLLILFAAGLPLIPVIYVFTSWLDFADYHLPTGAALAAGAVGTAFLIGALAMLWRAHWDLGRNWSPVLRIREKHTLVTDGIYAYVRHPIYAALWLWAIAQVLLLHNWIAGPATLLLFPPLYFCRVPREERMMLEHFGEEYSRYMSRTGRVLPRFAK